MATPMTAAPVKLRSVDMGAKMGRPPLRFHPLPARSRKLRIADDLHISPASADKLLYGERAVNKLYTQVIESDLRAGDTDSVALWTAPALAAEMGEDIPDLTDAWREYDEADAAEDAAEARLNHRAPADLTDDELEEYACRVARELFYGARLLARVRREQKRRNA